MPVEGTLNYTKLKKKIVNIIFVQKVYKPLPLYPMTHLLRKFDYMETIKVS